MSMFRTHFPFFAKGNEVYLDSAATSQRLLASLEASNDYLSIYNANVHRGSYASARKATAAYENARQVMANFIGAQSSDEIVFTSGTTEAINILAHGLIPELLDPATLAGKQILLCESEHHANLLPWQAFAKRHNMILTRITLGRSGIFGDSQLAAALASMTQNVAILAIAHVSNALGNIYPIKALCEKAQQMEIISVIDGTQAAAHLPIDVTEIGCDFYTISGHKMYASTGTGILYGKYSKLDKIRPIKLGGEMIKTVSWHDYTLQAAPLKFEAGTPNIAGAIGLACAARFIEDNICAIQQHEKKLYDYLLKCISPLVENGQVKLLGNQAPSISLVSFYVPKLHANDVASYLSVNNIAVRAGHHCAMPLMQTLNIEGCVRVSIACYTSVSDINDCVNALFSLLNDLKESSPNKNDEQQAKILVHNEHGALDKTQMLPIEIALKHAKDWNAKHRQLLLFSKQLNTLPAEQRTFEYEVNGCEAKVWIYFTNDAAKLNRTSSELRAQEVKAYSNSKVVRGILTLILSKLEHLSAQQIIDFDFNHYLTELGLSTYFSVGRKDGIGQIIKTIKAHFFTLT